MKILIDTQILYHIADISINNRIDKSKFRTVLKENQCYLTSTSIIEVIVKFRNSLNLIKQALNPLLSPDGVLQSQLILKDKVVDVKKIHRIYSAIKLEHVQKEIDEIFKYKIKIEAENAIFFLFMLVLSFLYLLEEDVENNDQAVERLKLYTDYLREQAKTITAEFQTAFLDGYKNENVEAVIKEKFSEKFKFFSDLFIVMKIYGTNKDILDSMDEEQLNSVLEEKMNKNRLYKRVKRCQNSSQNNPMGVFGYSEYQEKLDCFIEDYLNLYFSMKVSNKIYRQYISYKIGKFLFEGSKFKKNDILDMLIMGTLDFETETNNLQIITVDKANVQFLRSIYHSSVDIIDSILKQE